MVYLNPQFLFLGAAEEQGFLEMFSLDAQTFIQMVPHLISFIVLVLAFTYFLYKPVKRILQARADRIAEDVSTAEANKLAASELREEYEQRLRDIEAERTAILEEARADAAKRLNTILGHAKTEADEIRDKAKRDIVAEQERVKQEVHQAIIDIATDMAEKLVSATINKQDHDRLFNESLTELENTAFRPY